MQSDIITHISKKDLQQKYFFEQLKKKKNRQRADVDVMFFTKGDFKTSRPIKNAIHSYEKQKLEAKTQFVRFANELRAISSRNKYKTPYSARLLKDVSQQQIRHRDDQQLRGKPQRMSRSHNVSDINSVDKKSNNIRWSPIDFAQYVKLREMITPVPCLFDYNQQTGKQKSAGIQKQRGLRVAKQIQTELVKNQQQSKTKSPVSKKFREGIMQDFRIGYKTHQKIVSSILPYYMATLNKNQDSAQSLQQRVSKIDFGKMKRVDQIPTLRVRRKA